MADDTDMINPAPSVVDEGSELDPAIYGEQADDPRTPMLPADIQTIAEREDEAYRKAHA